MVTAAPAPIGALGRHLAGDAAAVVGALGLRARRGGRRRGGGAAPVQDRGADAGPRRQPAAARLQRAQLARRARDQGVHHLGAHPGKVHSLTRFHDTTLQYDSSVFIFPFVVILILWQHLVLS